MKFINNSNMLAALLLAATNFSNISAMDMDADRKGQEHAEPVAKSTARPLLNLKGLNLDFSLLAVSKPLDSIPRRSAAASAASALLEDMSSGGGSGEADGTSAVAAPELAQGPADKKRPRQKSPAAQEESADAVEAAADKSAPVKNQRH